MGEGFLKNVYCNQNHFPLRRVLLTFRANVVGSRLFLRCLCQSMMTAGAVPLGGRWWWTRSNSSIRWELFWRTKVCDKESKTTTCCNELLKDVILHTERRGPKIFPGGRMFTLSLGWTRLNVERVTYNFIKISYRNWPITMWKTYYRN